MGRTAFISGPRLCGAALLLPALLAIHAQSARAADPVGPYLGLYGGVVIPQGESWSGRIDGDDRRDRLHADYKSGPAVGIVSGYDYGDWRFEVEAGYQRAAADKAKDVRVNGIDRGNRDLSGHLNIWTVMANGYYDVDIGAAITPFVGIGLGVAVVAAKSVNVEGLGLSLDGSDPTFAYQGIVGAKMAVSEALSVNASYRYMGTANVKIDGAKATYHAHGLMAGLTYTLLSDPLPDFEPPPLNPPPKPAAQAFARSYVVFFDWDSAALSAEAEAIVVDAAEAAISLGTSRIELTGHADRSGTAGYNQALSQRRADAVRLMLIGLGMKASEIVTVAKGETAPLVPTPDGVREPQNRRVEIVL